MNINKLNDCITFKLLETGTDETTIAVNSYDEQNHSKIIHINREELVRQGRLLVLNKLGMSANEETGTQGFRSYFKDSIHFNDFDKTHWDNVLMFCAYQANTVMGKPEQTMRMADAKSLIYSTDTTFLSALSAITRDVLQPIYFDVMSSLADNFIEWHRLDKYGTQIVDLPSNDIFEYEDSAYKSGTSGKDNTLHETQIVINPEPKTSKGNFRWTQLVNGSASNYYLAFLKGMYSNMYGTFISKLQETITQEKFVPSDLQCVSYTLENFATLTSLVRSVNGVRDIMAVGSLKALTLLSQQIGQNLNISGIGAGISKDFFNDGYIAKYMGIDFFCINDAIVPHTQNNREKGGIKTIGLDRTIFFLPNKLISKPMYGAYYPDALFNVSLQPENDTIRMISRIEYAIEPVFNEKIGIMTL